MILVRHGESAFNAVFRETRVDPGLEDPPLTTAGRAQAEAAAKALAGDGVRRILTSPYMRALETADIIAQRLAAPVRVSVLVGERRAWSCDIGTPAAALAARWPALDFAHLAQRWWPEAEETHAEVAARGARFHRSMRADPNHGDMAVVSHWGFIRALTGLEVTNGALVRIRRGARVEVVTPPHP